MDGRPEKRHSAAGSGRRAHNRAILLESSVTAMTETKKGLFVLNGENLVFTFILVSSLFLLWGVCNG